MKIILLTVLCISLLFSACTQADTTAPNADSNANNQNRNALSKTMPLENGLISQKSRNNFEDTYAKLKAVIGKNQALKIIAEVDHADNAGKAGLTLRPTKLIIFGNPQLGTPLMNETQTLAIDLPQKILVYENEKAEIFIVYNDPNYLAERHNVNRSREELSKISAALKSLAETAAAN